MLAGRGSARGWRPGHPPLLHLAGGLVVLTVALSGCGGRHHAASSDPGLRRARVTVDAPPPPLSAYRGPSSGPRARPPAPVVFVAADATDEGIAIVARGVQQSATAIGWPLQIVDGQANAQTESQAIRTAVRERPGGIILGGVNAASQQAALQGARAHGVPVVGWHAATAPGPEPGAGLFTNVTSYPAQVARLAADYAIAQSGGTAGAVIFTDPAYAIDTYTSSLMASRMGHCRDCSVLAVLGQPIATASIDAVATVTALLERFGARFTYLLAVNGAFVDAARTALIGAGRAGDQPPFSVVAGEGTESEFARIRDNAYH